MQIIKNTSKIKNFIGLGTALALAVACTGPLDTATRDTDEENKRDLIEVKLVIEHQALLAGTNLLSTSTDDFVVKITGCSSGYTKTVTSTTASPVSTVSLYNYDTDCVAELESFAWDGKVWTRPLSARLGTGSAIFSEAGGAEMNVTVFDNLSSTLVDGEVVTYVFQQILLGSDFVVTDYTFSDTIEVLGIEAPNVKVEDVNLTAIATGTGVATFTVSIECNVLATGVSNEICTTPESIAQDMRNYKIAVVYDDPTAYAGVLSYSEAAAIATANGIAVQTAHLAAVGTNKGFTRPSVVMDIGPLYTHRNLLIVIEYSDPVLVGAKSYRYFNADIGTP